METSTIFKSTLILFAILFGLTTNGQQYLKNDFVNYSQAFEIKNFESLQSRNISFPINFSNNKLNFYSKNQNRFFDLLASQGVDIKMEHKINTRIYTSNLNNSSISIKVNRPCLLVWDFRKPTKR